MCLSLGIYVLEMFCSFSGVDIVLDYLSDRSVDGKIAANIITDDRNRLLPANAEKILFCSENLLEVNFIYF